MSTTRRWRENWLALACFAATAVLFLWPALARCGEASYTTADLSQAYSLTLTGPVLRPGNAQLSDPVVEMLPWLEFNASELAAGRLPTWNPYNGAGVPHLANYQSAVFSPFSLFHYVAPLKWALLLTAFAKLLVSGFATYLFLRALGLGALAASAGGVVYQFGGHNVLLLAYPHSSVAALFPAALFAVERAWQSAESPAGARARAGGVALWCSVLAALVACLLLGGNPETAAFAILTCALYAAARAVQFARRGPGRTRTAARVLASLAAASLLGLALAAVQVLPFLEYVSRSTLIELRAEGFDGLPLANWPLQFFPDLFGNPGLRYFPRPHLPYPNYEAANTSYFGPLAWMLALAGALQFRRRLAAGFFATLAAAWILSAHDVDWMRPAMVAFTELTRAPMNRSQLVPLFALAALSACAVDELVRGERPRRRLAAGASATVIVLLLWLAHGAADRLAAESYAGNVPAGHALRVPPHVAFMTWTVSLGAAAFVLLALARTAWLRALLGLALIAALWTQSALVLRPFNALSRDEHVYPRTAAIETLQREVGTERLQVIGEDTLPPHTNMVYGISTLAVYDALWVAEYDRLFSTLFLSEGNWRETFFGYASAAELFGVRYLLARDDWPRWDPGLPFDSTQPLAPPRPLAVPAGGVLEQAFRAHRAGLDRVVVALGAEDDPVPAFARLRLVDVASGATVASRRLDTHALRASLPKRALPQFAHDPRFGSPTGWVQLRFDPVPDSADREYRLELAAEPGAWRHGFLAWTTDDEAPDRRSLRLDGAALEGRLYFDFTANESRDLEVVARLDPFTLYRRTTRLSRFWTTLGAVAVPDAATALPTTLDIVRLGFVSHTVTGADDYTGVGPASIVVLEGVDPSANRPPGNDPDSTVRVLEEHPRRVRLACSTSRDAWLVAAIAWYPGWRASVDGVPVELVKANYAFLGVPLPAGEHEVVLEFESQSVRLGAWISAAALLLVVATALCGRRLRRP